MSGGPHHDPSNRAMLVAINLRTLDLQSRLDSQERYIAALVQDRATQRKLVNHITRLIAQKDALLAAVGRQALDKSYAACIHQWELLGESIHATMLIRCSICKTIKEFE